MRHLYDTPKTTRPPLGSAPQFVKRGRKGAKRQQTPSTDILTFDIEGNNYHFKLPDWWDTVEVEMPKDVRTDGDLARYVEEKYGQDVGTATTWRQALKCWALYDAKHGYLPVYIAHCFAVGGQHQKAVNTYTDLWDVASLLSKNKTWYSTYLAFEAGRQYLQICQIALAKAWLKKAAARKRVGDDAVKYYASEAHRILKEI